MKAIKEERNMLNTDFFFLSQSVLPKGKKERKGKKLERWPASQKAFPHKKS